MAPLIQGSDGNFYGTTFQGGNDNSYGVIFKITPKGKLTDLHDFNAPGSGDGFSPVAGLVQGTDGNLYGTTQYGGTSGDGTIFRISMKGEYAVIYNFDGTTGSAPEMGL